MPSDQLRRREFITLLGGAVAWPLAARALEAKRPTIGLLGGATASAQAQWTAAFVQRLRELGWVEGQTVATCNPGKPRSADAPHSQLPCSAVDAGPGASRFALSSRASPRRAPELRTDRARVLCYPCWSVAD